MLAGTLAGLLAGGLAAWFVASDPGRGRAAPGTLRGDLDVIQEHVISVDTRLAVSQAGWQAALDRMAAIEATGTESPHAIEEIRAVAQDLKSIRDALVGELRVLDARIGDLRRRLGDAGSQSGPATVSPDTPPTQEDVDRWATLARDADAGIRFSALSRLGRFRTERSVQLSVERLSDDDVEVVWQAVRNLGRFRERDAAAQIAPLLHHGEAVIRDAAHQALMAMGAPKDTEFTATASPEKRKAAADALKRWAESP